VSEPKIHVAKVKVVSPPPHNWQVTVVVIEPKTKDAPANVFGLTSELKSEQDAERFVQILKKRLGTPS
jgi:hypothetical protein